MGDKPSKINALRDFSGVKNDGFFSWVKRECVRGEIKKSCYPTSTLENTDASALAKHENHMILLEG